MSAVIRLSLACLACMALVAFAAQAREPSGRLFPLYLANVKQGWSSAAYGDLSAFPDGSVMVVSYEPRFRMVRIAPDGTVTRVRVPVPEEDFHPQDLLTLPDGTVLYARRDRVWRVSPDGTLRVVAGAESDGRHVRYSGEGGAATDAALDRPHGLAVTDDGSVLFSDWDRVLRVSPSGRISTVAGSDAAGFSGDGGPATAARLNNPTDVVVMPDGGFAFIDAGNLRVRAVSASGTIRTIAGNGELARNNADTRDGGPAVEARLGDPRVLAVLPDGTLYIAGQTTVRKVDAQGIITRVLNLRSPVRGNRIGDFAGRNARPVDGMVVTPEGGVALSVVEAFAQAPVESRSIRRYGSRQVVYYLAPATTARTLVAQRDTRVTEGRITVVFDATRAGTARLEVRRRDRLVTAVDQAVGAGRNAIRAVGAFGDETYDVSVSLRGEGSRTARDQVSPFTGSVLARRHLASTLTFLGHEGRRRCKRFSSRRIDCNVWRRPDFEVPVRCAATVSFRLYPSGMLFGRHYRRPCRRFAVRPVWRADWYVPVRLAGG
jgi:hypothetical protein